VNDPGHPQSLVLVGYRGTGKSTVGRILAERLGLAFADADVELEALAGRPIPAIFAEQGEAAFRDWEERVLSDLCTRRGAVLATGGGVVLRERNRSLIRSFGFVVWLTADPEVLAARLRADPRGLANRPSLTAEGTLGEIARVLGERTHLYRAVAHAIVDTNQRTPAQTAEAILELWPRP
jgi:shikimate kinase